MLHKGLTDIFRSSPRLSSSLKETLLAQMMIRQRLHFHFKESTKRSQKEDNLRLAFQLSMHVSCKLQVEISLFCCKESGMLAKYSGLFHYQRYFQMMSPCFFLKKGLIFCTFRESRFVQRSFSSSCLWTQCSQVTFLLACKQGYRWLVVLSSFFPPSRRIQRNVCRLKFVLVGGGVDLLFLLPTTRSNSLRSMNKLSYKSNRR